MDEMMPACAHISIRYRPIVIDEQKGLMQERWACVDCGTEFVQERKYRKLKEEAENDHDEILKAAIHATDVSRSCHLSDPKCSNEHNQLANWLHRLIGLQAEVDAYRKLMREPWKEVEIVDDDPDDVWDKVCDEIGYRDKYPVILFRFIKQRKNNESKMPQ